MLRPLNESKTDGEECRRGATPRKDVFSSGCVYCIQPFPIPNHKSEPLDLPRSPPRTAPLMPPNLLHHTPFFSWTTVYSLSPGQL